MERNRAWLLVPGLMSWEVRFRNAETEAKPRNSSQVFFHGLWPSRQLHAMLLIWLSTQVALDFMPSPLRLLLGMGAVGSSSAIIASSTLSLQWP